MKLLIVVVWLRFDDCALVTLVVLCLWFVGCFVLECWTLFVFRFAICLLLYCNSVACLFLCLFDMCWLLGFVRLCYELFAVFDFVVWMLPLGC